jgi:hypothetical protein
MLWWLSPHNCVDIMTTVLIPIQGACQNRNTLINIALFNYGNIHEIILRKEIVI